MPHNGGALRWLGIWNTNAQLLAKAYWKTKDEDLFVRPTIAKHFVRCRHGQLESNLKTLWCKGEPHIDYDKYIQFCKTRIRHS